MRGLKHSRASSSQHEKVKLTRMPEANQRTAALRAVSGDFAHNCLLAPENRGCILLL